MENMTILEIRTALKGLNMNNPGPDNHRDNPGINMRKGKKVHSLQLKKSPATHAPQLGNRKSERKRRKIE
jgi:hypothetical protein